MNFYSLAVIVVIFVVGLIVYTCENQEDEGKPPSSLSEEL